MSEKPINPLRRRMIEDMTVRNFVEKTRNDYIRRVRTFMKAFSAARQIRPRLKIFAFSSYTRHRPAPGHQASMARLWRCVSSSPVTLRLAPELRKVPHLRAGAAQDPGNLEPGGDRTAAGGGPRAEVQGRAERRLWRWTAGFRKSWR